MKHTSFTTLFALIFALLCGLPSVTHAQGASIEWDTLNTEVMNLYRAGNYARAVVVDQKALQVAEQNVDPDHPPVATSLETLRYCIGPQSVILRLSVGAARGANSRHEEMTWLTTGYNTVITLAFQELLFSLDS